MEKVMAQGTFDLLHPGHIHYLEKSSELGDRLVVVIARDSRVRERKNLVFTEDERRELIDSLEVVDKAVMGVEGDIYRTVEEVNPDTITLGYDQDHSAEDVKILAEEATGHEVKVETVSRSDQEYSSSDIKANLQEKSS